MCTHKERHTQNLRQTNVHKCRDILLYTTIYIYIQEAARSVCDYENARLLMICLCGAARGALLIHIARSVQCVVNLVFARATRFAAVHNAHTHIGEAAAAAVGV